MLAQFRLRKNDLLFRVAGGVVKTGVKADPKAQRRRGTGDRAVCRRIRVNGSRRDLLGVFCRIREKLVSSSRRSRPSQNHLDRTARSAQGARRFGAAEQTLAHEHRSVMTGNSDGRIRRDERHPAGGLRAVWPLPEATGVPDAVAAHSVQIIQHLFPTLHRLPLRHHPRQRQIQQFEGGLFGGK